MADSFQFYPFPTPHTNSSLSSPASPSHTCHTPILPGLTHVGSLPLALRPKLGILENYPSPGTLSRL